MSFGASPEFNPFDQSDYQRLISLERRINQFLPELDKAERCGVGCEQFRAVLTEVLSVLGNIKREYMEGRMA